MKIKILMFFLIILTIAGCSNTNNDNKKQAVFVDVVIQMDHSQLQVGKEVMIKAIVTQGEEKVNDADEVEFELWADGDKDNSEFVPGKNSSDGVYFMKKVFNTPGKYSVTAHVTARGMHTMPTEDFEIK